MSVFEMIPAADLEDAARIARTLGPSVILDLDGTLTASGSGDDLPAGLLAGFSAFTDVVIVSNGSLGHRGVGGVRVVERARKPWTRRSLLGGSPACVIGDQYLTDGLLAARLRVPYVRVPSLDHRRRPLARLGDWGLSWLFSRRRRRV